MSKSSTIRRAKRRASQMDKLSQGAAQSGALAAMQQMAAVSMKVGQQTVKGSPGKPDLVLPTYYCPHPRGRAILMSALLKRKFFADSIRELRRTATPEQRAEMRKKSIEGRKRRQGWAQV